LRREENRRTQLKTLEARERINNKLNSLTLMMVTCDNVDDDDDNDDDDDDNDNVTN
jgi:hypothetical protein